MSTETTEQMEMGTKPVKEHEWLQKLVGEWRVVSEFQMGPGGPLQQSEGRDTTKSVGGLWAFSQGIGHMPDGSEFSMFATLGYDVSFKEYRGCWFASMSSHLWQYIGTLSDDGKVMTLNCRGPHMEKDGETANYRDVIEILDDNHRTLTSYGQDDDGNWQQFMKATYTRV